MSRYEIEHNPARRATFSGKTIPETWRVIHTATGQSYGLCYSEAEALARRAQLDALPEPEPKAPSQAPDTGWSNAARRRAGQPTRTVDTPLGRGIRSGKGYTMYEDLNGDGFNTQIWDES